MKKKKKTMKNEENRNKRWIYKEIKIVEYSPFVWSKYYS